MKYLHSMIRTRNLHKTLDFYVNKLGLIEVKRYDNDIGKFTLVFLCASDDYKNAKNFQSPLIEITYNWPNHKGDIEELDTGRSFGHLAFRVRDIYETCDKLMKNSITINRPPKDGHMAFIKSPDNISIELLQEGEPLKPKEPWVSMKNIGTW